MRTEAIFGGTENKPIAAVNALKLKELALEQGASLVGIAPPQVSDLWSVRHRRWLARDYQGDMAYLARAPEGRYDARSLLPDCQSVLAIGLNYWQPGRTGQGGKLKVSRYAWGQDYHTVMTDKLRAIGGWLEAHAPGSRWKACVDHSPLGEKAFAIAAGLGWEGRNTLLLNPKHGSYVFLGLLLTTVYLQPDTPLKADCGSCTLCLRACPTSALLGPGILDARRCISYLNTECREAAAGGTDLHGWAYGCDECQDVCPFNQALVASGEPALQRRAWLDSFTPEAELALDEAGFESKYAGTVIRRRRLERWQAQVRAASASS